MLLFKKKKEKSFEELEEESHNKIKAEIAEIQNMTQEQFEAECNVCTTFEEELVNFANVLAQRKKDGNLDFSEEKKSEKE